MPEIQSNPISAIPFVAKSGLVVSGSSFADVQSGSVVVTDTLIVKDWICPPGRRISIDADGNKVETDLSGNWDTGSLPRTGEDPAKYTYQLSPNAWSGSTGIDTY